MAITTASVTTGGTASTASSYTTASVTPTTGRLQLLWVANIKAAATVTTPTVTGCGLTWVQVATVSFATIASPVKRFTLFRAMGTATTGTLTIDFGGVNQTGCSWAWDEFDGINTSGTNGSGAIVQAPTNVDDVATNTSMTVSYATFGGSGNRGVAGFHTGQVAGITPRSSPAWSELHDQDVIGIGSLEVQWYSTTTDTAASATYGASRCAGIAVELKIAGSTVNGGAALSGAGAVAAGGTRTSLGGGSLSGAGTAAAGGVRSAIAAAALSGSGTLKAGGLRTAEGGAALTGSGTLAAGGARIAEGGAALAGAGSLAAGGVRTALGGVALSGDGDLEAGGLRETFAGGLLDGEGSLEAGGSASRVGGAVLTGSGTLTAHFYDFFPGGAVLEGSGTLSAGGTVFPRQWPQHSDEEGWDQDNDARWLASAGDRWGQ